MIQSDVDSRQARKARCLKDSGGERGLNMRFTRIIAEHGFMKLVLAWRSHGGIAPIKKKKRHC